MFPSPSSGITWRLFDSVIAHTTVAGLLVTAFKVLPQGRQPLVGTEYKGTYGHSLERVMGQLGKQ